MKSKVLSILTAAFFLGTGVVVVKNHDTHSSDSEKSISITKLSPDSTYAGGFGGTLYIIGDKFTGKCSVSWNGAARETKCVSPNILQVSILPDDIVEPSTAKITVWRLTGNVGASSNTVDFTIKNHLTNGLPGPSGPAGLKGDKGDTGEQGLKGDAGRTGVAGIQGLQGDKGDTGADGSMGPVGPQGVAGIQGLQGIAGKDGTVGPQGPIGPQGITGLQGIPGPQGPAGPQGIAGAACVSCSNSSDKNNWSITGSLNTGRYCNTTCLLPNGNVITAGGCGPNGYLSSAECYNPQSGTWSVVATMNSIRYSFASALLPNGTVLVMGGYNGGGYNTSAEIYDPASDKWTPTGSMANARASFTATTLPNGNVLVVGGETGWNFFTSAEVYNPTTGKWSDTGSLNNAHAYHSAVVLAKNTVLIFGGGENQAEIYNIASGTFSLAFNVGDGMPTILADGRVLLSGLQDDECALYDPRANIVGTTGCMISLGQILFNSTLLQNGKVLATSNNDILGKETACELFTPITGTWTTTAPMLTPHHNYTSTLLKNGKVLIVGDGTLADSEFSTECELYTPSDCAQ